MIIAVFGVIITNLGTVIALYIKRKEVMFLEALLGFIVFLIYAYWVEKEPDY